MPLVDEEKGWLHENIHSMLSMFSREFDSLHIGLWVMFLFVLSSIYFQ